MARSRSRSRSPSKSRSRSNSPKNGSPRKGKEDDTQSKPGSSSNSDDKTPNPIPGPGGTDAEPEASNGNLEGGGGGDNGDDEPSDEDEDDEGETPLVKILPEPDTSPRDPNHYRVIELRNGLRAVLISTLGYASDEAKKHVLERERSRQVCEDQPDTSVFNRRRSRRHEKKHNVNVAEDEINARHLRRAESKNNEKCIDKDVAKFDRDMNLRGTRVKRDSTKSILDDLFESTENATVEPMELDATDEADAAKRASTTTAQPSAGGSEDEDDEEEDDDVFKDENTPSKPENDKSPPSADNKSSTPIKSKWGPEPETTDPEILEEERRIMQRKMPEVEIALTFAAGSLHDDREIPGLSHLAREAVIRSLKEKDIHPFQQQFNPAEFTTIRLTTTIETLKTSLQHMTSHVERLKIGKRSVIHDIDLLDELEEDIQCRLCWDHPMIDERRLAILGLLAKEGHPVRVISSGHPPKLWAAELSSHHDELEKHIFEFITAHYTGTGGTLAIQASETLDNLQDAVSAFNELFPGTKVEFVADPEPFNTDEFKMFYKVYCSNPHCSDMGDAYLVIAWALPPSYWQNHVTKPLDYLGAFISDKSPGGLVHYLREKNLVWDLNAGCSDATKGYHRNRFCSLFEIQVTLNESGYENSDEVIKIIFSYLKFLKVNGPSKAFFKEQQKIRSTQFHAIGQEIDLNDPYPISISKLSLGLELYGSRDFLTAPIILRKYDEKIIQDCIDLLVPETCNFMLCLCEDEDVVTVPTKTGSPQDGSPETKIEATFGTKYKASPISPERLKMWSDVEVYQDFKFPGPNPFIHDDECRLQLEDDAGNYNLYEPESDNGEFYRIWYHQDRREDHFAIYYIHVVSPVSFACIENSVMLQIWYLLLQDLLHPLLGPAEAAGIEYNLKPTHYGLLIAVFSWNSKILKVVELILQEISKFETNINQDAFKKKKKGYLKHLAGLIKDEYLSNPNISRDLFQSIAHVNRWKLTEVYNELLTIHMKDFDQFLKNFKRRFSIAALLRGNVNSSKANDFADIIESSLVPNYYIKKYHVRQNLMPKHNHILRFHTLSEWSTDNYVYNAYQIGITCLKQRVCADLFHMCLEEYIYHHEDELRASAARQSADEKLKLSRPTRSRKKNPDKIALETYNIRAGLQEEQGIVTLFLESYGTISHFSLEKLDRRADMLLKQLYDAKFAKLSEKEFKHLKHRLSERKYNDGDTGIWGGNESYFYDLSGAYGAIEDLTYRFTETECKLEALRSLTLDNLHDFYDRHLIPDVCEFRKLSIQIHGNLTKDLPEKLDAPHSREEWRQRRKNFRECTFNDYHKLIHAHKKGKSERFHIDFDDDEDGKCSNALFITDTLAFKRGLFQFPTKICQH